MAISVIGTKINAVLDQAATDSISIDAVVSAVIDNYNRRVVAAQSVSFPLPADYYDDHDWWAVRTFVDTGGASGLDWFTALTKAAEAAKTGTQQNFWKYLLYAARALKRDYPTLPDFDPRKFEVLYGVAKVA